MAHFQLCKKDDSKQISHTVNQDLFNLVHTSNGSFKLIGVLHLVAITTTLPKLL